MISISFEDLDTKYTYDLIHIAQFIMPLLTTGHRAPVTMTVHDK